MRPLFFHRPQPQHPAPPHNAPAAAGCPRGRRGTNAAACRATRPSRSAARAVAVAAVMRVAGRIIILRCPVSSGLACLLCTKGDPVRERRWQRGVVGMVSGMASAHCQSAFNHALESKAKTERIDHASAVDASARAARGFLFDFEIPRDVRSEPLFKRTRLLRTQFLDQPKTGRHAGGCRN